MKLSKALKLKNKKVNEYNNLITKMVSHNSYDIDTKKVYNSQSDKSTYACSINEEKKVEMMEWYQNAIETIQDEIDVFNATTELVGY